MRIVAYDPFADTAFADANGVQLVSFDQLLRESDVVTLHVRLNEKTRHLVGRDQFAMMKPTAILVNAARKDLVDEQAMVEAILEKRLGGAGLDDPPGPAGKRLFGLPSVVFTTHLGNRAVEGMISVLRGAVESAVAVLRGDRPKLVLNPDVYERGTRR
jgi:phosphoglycerate dehydrogenase-like enzyme